MSGWRSIGIGLCFGSAAVVILLAVVFPVLRYVALLAVAVLVWYALREDQES
jgi:hypothetical protein